MARAMALMGGGFLLAVLWFDLKFDALAFEAMRGGPPVGPEALATIRSYYTQATSAEMNGFPLIMTMMAMAIAGTLLQLRERGRALWLRLPGVILVIPPIALAGLRIVPNARTLGAGDLGLAEQSDLAIVILQQHLFCITFIFLFLLLQLWDTLRT